MAENEKFELHVAVCDDEPAAVEALVKACGDILREEFLVRFHTANSMEELLSDPCPFQVALLDVQLVESSGIDLARALLDREPACRILFVSGYLSAVTQVYTVPHFCFILKDQLRQHLPEFLLRAARSAAQSAGRQLTVSCGRRFLSLRLDRISYIERSGHRTTIVMTDGETFSIREKLGDLLERIHCQSFFRCHVSFIVNLDHAAALEGSCFRMESGDLITISRPNEKEAREAFFRCLRERI